MDRSGGCGNKSGEKMTEVVFGEQLVLEASNTFNVYISISGNERIENL